MFLGNVVHTKDLIIKTLSKGAIDSVQLQKEIYLQKKVTKQGFYKALRELVAEEIVVKNKQLLLLNNVWVNRLFNFLNDIDANYQNQARESFLNLEEGDSLTYHFKSLSSLDSLWMHYFFIVAKKELQEPIIFYQSHEFWSLFRAETENFMYKWIKDSDREVYELIGSTTILDKTTTVKMKEYGFNVAYQDSMLLPKNYFTAVIGDYIIDTVLDMNTARAIDNLYKNNIVWNENISKELHNILLCLKKSKVVIYRNKKKAEKLRKKILTYFIFYKKE